MADKIMTPDEFYKRLSKEDRRAVKNLNEKPKTDFIPTGSWIINTLIGDGSGTYKQGGLPRGHIVEVYGDESCGKTTLGICGCIEAQKLGGIPVWLDFERTFSPDYAIRLGLDLSPKKFIFIEPYHFEHGFRMILDTLALRPPIIVCDSVSAMIPKDFLEGAIDEQARIGRQAQLMSQCLNFITKHLSDYNTCLFFTNQLRSVIKKSQYDVGPDEETSGGRALRYYSSLRIKMRKSTIEKVNVKSRITGKIEKEPINIMIKVEIRKNKIDKPYYSGPVYIRFGEGYDNITSIIELAINTNVIKKTGAFLRFDQGGKTLFNSQGKEQLRTQLEEDEALLKTLTSSIVFKEDDLVRQEETSEDDAILEDGNVELVKSKEELEALLERSSETAKASEAAKASKKKHAKDQD